MIPVNALIIFLFRRSRPFTMARRKKKIEQLPETNQAFSTKFFKATGDENNVGGMFITKT